jgi:predicted DNA-binding transcriptional regulator AlpA
MVPSMTTRTVTKWPDPIETPTLPLVEAARWIGFGRSTAYDAVQAGTFPLPVIRVGKKLRVPTAAVIRMLEGHAGTPGAA